MKKDVARRERRCKNGLKVSAVHTERYEAGCVSIVADRHAMAEQNRTERSCRPAEVTSTRRGRIVQRYASVRG